MTLPGQAESLFHSCLASQYSIVIICGFQWSALYTRGGQNK